MDFLNQQHREEKAHKLKATQQQEYNQSKTTSSVFLGEMNAKLGIALQNEDQAQKHTYIAATLSNEPTAIEPLSHHFLVLFSSVRTSEIKQVKIPKPETQMSVWTNFCW